MSTMRRTRWIPLALAGTLALPFLLASPGCIVAAFAGHVAQSAYLAGETIYPAEYDGLDGKTYAVVVSADRAIQAEHPGIVPRVTDRVNSLIAEHSEAAGHIPTPSLLGVLYNNPQWQAMPRGDLGERLGVERLVVVELLEYRLTEPGNRYIWDGAATAIVEVYEIDSGVPDEPLFEHSIVVRFPDHSGVVQERYTREAITSTLSRRLTDRVAWLFYEHAEPNDIAY